MSAKPAEAWIWAGDADKAMEAERNEITLIRDEKKLQQANSTTTSSYIPSVLYLSIIENVEEAFRKDFNLIVENYEFYQQLTPKMQTKVITQIFEEFRQSFRHWFDPCDRGFVNEAII